MSVKRLLCIMNSTNVGGAETFIMKVFRQLDRNKYVIDFCINVFEECAYDKEIERLGGKIFRIPSKTSNIFLFRRELSKIVRDNNYKYVLRITSNAGGFYDLKVAKKAGALVCSARSSNSSDGKSLKHRIIHFIGSKMWLKFIDRKISPSIKAAKYTFGSAEGVFLLNNGLDLKKFSYDDEARIKIRAELGIDDSAMLLGHVGRFDTQKNHMFLIEVFNEYHKINKNSYLILVGIGRLQETIRKKALALNISEFVIFAGLREDIPQLMSAMDFMVFPSLYEGMPNVIIEAQASNLPCLLSDTITREVGITDLISFASLKNDSLSSWINKIVRNPRRDVSNDEVRKSGYDIVDVTKEFIRIVFSETIK